MSGLTWALIFTISALGSAEPSPGRNNVEDDINQLMSRFMFDDYENNMADEYPQTEQELHFSSKQPRPSPQTNHHRQNSQGAADQETKVTPQAQEKPNESTIKSENSENAASVDPKLRDFTLIISKLLFHLSQL